MRSMAEGARATTIIRRRKRSVLSFWGDGDRNNVTIVFECDLQIRRIKSYTVTS